MDKMEISLAPCERRSSERRQANTALAAPTGDGAVVLDFVLDRIKRMEEVGSIGPVGYTALREDLIARAESGLKKYGTRLRVNNGRAPQVDFYQELLDAIMYSMQARLERTDSISNESFELLVSLASRLAVELNERAS
jgi:hypothetical protein